MNVLNESLRIFPPLRIIATIGVLIACACNFDPGASANEVCLEIAGAVAHQTLTCTGDDTLANARFDRLRNDYTCDKSAFHDACTDFSDELSCSSAGCAYHEGKCSGGGVVAGEFAFACAAGIGQLSCSQVEDYGDDLTLWLDVRPSCAILVARQEAP